MNGKDRTKIMRGPADVVIGQTKVWYMGTVSIEYGHVPDRNGASEVDSFVYLGERVFPSEIMSGARTMWTRGHPFGLFFDAWVHELYFAGIGIRNTEDCDGNAAVEVYEFMS